MNDRNIEALRREIIGDFAADTIDALIDASPAGKETNDELDAKIAALSPIQKILLNLSDVWMQVAIAEDEPRLAYASVAALSICNLDDQFDLFTWEDIMDYSEHVWDSIQDKMGDLALKGFTATPDF